ncbi:MULTISPECIES: sulfur carrier protein ThiS [Acinetobacter]|uniref:sulfur carrier protein ThiS n=1 Tax=Acinetobacter TaxID=469 RepID=UPI000DCFB40D|nr:MULTISPECIES: sulfur carrier protein ThiS [Acinetobacter]MCG2572581.1 sulfur carrier protein ThiS [Acinetobacter sp. ME22]TCB85809.1 sulfur carrier protein ThiS [Acinetobacter sp. ANC 3791]
MQIFLNGVATETSCENLLTLVQSLALENKRFAVELNEMIVPKSKLEQTQIQAQDHIEIIHAVGGG